MSAKNPLKEYPEHRIWKGIIGRCEDKNLPDYHRYGGRGISIHPLWRADFLAFLSEIGRRPSSKYSVDRIDNNKGYEPGNVRWATKTEQAQNKRPNVNLTVFGETHCMSEWARRNGLPLQLVWQRIVVLGWEKERAITTPSESVSWRSKTTADQVREIRKLAANGMKMKDIVLQVNVGRTSCQKIIKGAIFSHVK